MSVSMKTKPARFTPGLWIRALLILSGVGLGLCALVAPRRAPLLLSGLLLGLCATLPAIWRSATRSRAA